MKGMHFSTKNAHLLNYIFGHNAECLYALGHNAECHAITLSVVAPKVVLLGVVMLRVVYLKVIMLSVIMISAIIVITRVRGWIQDTYQHIKSN